MNINGIPMNILDLQMKGKKTQKFNPEKDHFPQSMKKDVRKKNMFRNEP
jgi:hypothetical protein